MWRAGPSHPRCLPVWSQRLKCQAARSRVLICHPGSEGEGRWGPESQGGQGAGRRRCRQEAGSCPLSSQQELGMGHPVPSHPPTPSKHVTTVPTFLTRESRPRKGMEVAFRRLSVPRPECPALTPAPPAGKTDLMSTAAIGSAQPAVEPQFPQPWADMGSFLGLLGNIWWPAPIR